VGYRPTMPTTTEDFSLRPIDAQDVAAIATLIRTAFAAQSVVTDPPPSALHVTEADITTHLCQGTGVVAEAGGDLVGSALWNEHKDGLYLGRLAVAPAWRRRGIARALILAAEMATRKAGLPRLYLSTRLVLLDNRRLFAACGFVETAREAHPGYAEPTFVNLEKRLAE
jgi:predicted N-acetyltransferase YhbS